jgi:hypothetical protein
MIRVRAELTRLRSISIDLVVAPEQVGAGRNGRSIIRKRHYDLTLVDLTGKVFLQEACKKKVFRKLGKETGKIRCSEA